MFRFVPFALLALASHATAADPLLAGVARVEITDRRILPANDPLYVKALVLRSGSTTAVLITLDVVAVGEIGRIGNDYLRTVRDRLQEEAKIPPGNVIVNASHCHGLPGPDVDKKTVEAVKAALTKLEPVKAGTGVGMESGVSENRRLRLANGHESDVRHAYSLPPDATVAAVGPIDPQIGLLRLDRLDGTPLAVVYNFACHPILGIHGDGNTADLVGFASKTIEENLPGATALFVQGCGGDINPIRYKDVAAPRHAETLGQKLGLSVLRAVRGIRTAPGAPLVIRNEPLALPRADHSERIEKLTAEQTKLVNSFQGTTLNLKTFLELSMKHNLAAEFPSYDSHLYLTEKQHGRDGLAKLDEANRRNVRAYLDNVLAMEQLTRVKANLALLKKHEATNRAAGRKPLEVEVAGLRVGDFALVTFPGELTVEIGLTIKKASPRKSTFVAGYTNGYIYYTPTAKQLRNPGSAQEDCDTLVAPEWEDRFHMKVAELIKGL
jgi:hypothetical protein